jgi:hypothetical protein
MVKGLVEKFQAAHVLGQHRGIPAARKDRSRASLEETCHDDRDGFVRH